MGWSLLLLNVVDPGCDQIQTSLTVVQVRRLAVLAAAVVPVLVAAVVPVADFVLVLRRGQYRESTAQVQSRPWGEWMGLKMRCPTGHDCHHHLS